MVRAMPTVFYEAPLFKVITALKLHSSSLLTTEVYALATRFMSVRTENVSSSQPLT